MYVQYRSEEVHASLDTRHLGQERDGKDSPNDQYSSEIRTAPEKKKRTWWRRKEAPGKQTDTDEVVQRRKKPGTASHSPVPHAGQRGVV